ncbi:MAG: TadE family protein [Candidatus Dormibacteria bacterium]
MWYRGRGQSVVEFALVAPIFFAVIFGIIAAGWLFFQNSAVSNAAQGGARESLVEVPLVQKPTTGAYTADECESGTPRAITAAAQQAANILPLDPNPLCNLPTPNPACNYTSGEYADALSQTAVAGDASICLLVQGGFTTWTQITVTVVYVAHPLEPLLGSSVDLSSSSIITPQTAS